MLGPLFPSTQHQLPGPLKDGWHETVDGGVLSVHDMGVALKSQSAPASSDVHPGDDAQHSSPGAIIQGQLSCGRLEGWHPTP